MPQPRPKAFTLIELLVVIAIISLLISIVLPALGQAQRVTKRTLCAQGQKQIYLSFNMYLHDYRDTYPCNTQDPDGIWLWMGRGWRSFVQPYLGQGQRENSVLWCPEDQTPYEKYESTSYSYSMTFYHSPEQIDTLSSVSDTYGTGSLPSIAQRLNSVRYPSSKIMVGEWASYHQPTEADNGWWCWLGARNFLLADGQVRFITAQQIRPANDALPDANLTTHGIQGIDVIQ
ncbi:MAG: prepilin-type N-terminal cleavage/methylation domain-containing protein [Sedimentisphaerales bacterium]|nr:prepilin-type N-terminal cleavage/methylation domain-containing protein [Sedimentisphaerales bacterium]